MVASRATNVREYLAELPEGRRKAVKAVRKVIRKNLPKGYVESMQYGMICYVVPPQRFPSPYNGAPLAYVSLASHRNHMAVYLMGIYSDKEQRRWFENEYRKTGKRMDIGRCCVRFKNVEDLPLALVGDAVAAMSVQDFLSLYEKARGRSRSHGKRR